MLKCGKFTIIFSICIEKSPDLPRVHLQEDAEGNFHTRNLTVHQANSEEDGMQ